ncbi:MAG: lysophospholipid acyltransferase family protein, partial [Bacteroidaceae bacterium]
QETIEKARHTLQDGTSLVVFPEGARTYTGHMGIFRKGAFQLAKDLQLPIVPITIDGSFDILPRTRGFWFVNHHKMRLIIHQPILPQDNSRADVHQTMKESYQIIMDALPMKNRGFIKNDDQ